MTAFVRYALLTFLFIILPFHQKAQAGERDGFNYYMAHLSEYKGKEIRVLANDPRVVAENSFREGFVDTEIYTEDGSVRCLVKKDRVDAFIRRYKGYDPIYLRGTLLVSNNEVPYLLIDGF